MKLSHAEHAEHAERTMRYFNNKPGNLAYDMLTFPDITPVVIIYEYQISLTKHALDGKFNFMGINKKLVLEISIRRHILNQIFYSINKIN
ncbi:hypothetical protein RCL_jg6584.t1 [Rhizophagus clarus]|uniref:Uncharacterized protein n=1 Tax=Rhizophagus clarus TaxID=94130 RepID=A0A8H3QLP5_9GLOM|nr:hypothetical protein RCL_jg6584.t1 [Rhizophagus clarus]